MFFRVVVLVSLFSVPDVLFVYTQAVTLKPGKKQKSGLLELLCVEVSPAGGVLLLSSGFSALSLNQGVWFASSFILSELLSPLLSNFAVSSKSGFTHPFCSYPVSDVSPHATYHRRMQDNLLSSQISSNRK